MKLPEMLKKSYKNVVKYDWLFKKILSSIFPFYRVFPIHLQSQAFLEGYKVIKT